MLVICLQKDRQVGGLYHTDPLVEAMESAEEQLQPEQLASVKIPVADKGNKLDPELGAKIIIAKNGRKQTRRIKDVTKYKAQDKRCKIIPVYLFSLEVG